MNKLIIEEHTINNINPTHFSELYNASKFAKGLRIHLADGWLWLMNWHINLSSKNDIQRLHSP